MLDERWLMETEEEGFRPRFSITGGGPLLLPMVERRRGRLVGATMGRDGGVVVGFSGWRKNQGAAR